MFFNIFFYILLLLPLQNETGGGSDNSPVEGHVDQPTNFLPQCGSNMELCTISLEG